MNANELMIGDWVRIKDPDRYAGAIGKISSLTSLEGGYYAINISDVHFGYLMTEVFCEDIEPIPLTEEVLFRNFQAGDDEVAWWENTEFENDAKDEYLWWHIVVTGQTLVIQGEIRYVHELQHAMRLAGINKEFTI